MRPHRSFGHTATVSIFRFALALSLSAAGASAAYGGTAYEPFDYAPGTPKTNWSGGSGFINKWQADGGSIVAGSLTDPTGTLATSGNHAEGSGNA
jgi:hypothetical protein